MSKKYIANANLVHNGEIVSRGHFVELEDEQAEQLGNRVILESSITEEEYEELFGPDYVEEDNGAIKLTEEDALRRQLGNPKSNPWRSERIPYYG